MAKYIAKHVEKDNGEEVLVTSSSYDTKLDALYGADSAFNWAKQTAQYMSGIVDFEDDNGQIQTVYESRGFQKGSRRR